MLTVLKTYKNGIASELGIKKGDVISHFNGYPVVDILDYLYYDSQEFFTLSVIKKSGETQTFEVEKYEDESLGVTFESDNLEIKKCRNKCVFCFVDQMPKGMRSSLYVKDDDYRQSFLRGNFVTLTNVTDSDIDRIIRLNLSPMYVSVHATNPSVREKLLGNRFAGDILKKLEKLTKNGIKVETQVVVVPTLNDGAVLSQTCKDLFNLGKNLLSVAVVPCGITKYRNGLYPIEDFSKGYAECTIKQAEMLNAEFGKNFVTLADEFYFKAGMPVKPAEFYGDFLQVGNGVGVTAKFDLELNLALKNKTYNKNAVVISGVSASGFITEKVNLVKSFVKGLNCEVVAVKNAFFGETVNCTGLLTGEDIFNAVKDISNYETLILHDVCLKQDEDVFLDGLSLLALKEKLNKKIIVTDGTGQSFFDALSGGKQVRII